jgi:hypothetical protein
MVVMVIKIVIILFRLRECKPDLSIVTIIVFVPVFARSYFTIDPKADE